MAIRVKCPSCQQTLKAEDRHAGKTVRCPACRSAVTIPAAEPPIVQETLDPFANAAEGTSLDRINPGPPPQELKKKPAPKPDGSVNVRTAPTVSEEEVGEWLSEGLPPPSPEEVAELPPQTPNWDGTTSTYDIAEVGPDDPPPRKRRRKG